MVLEIASSVVFDCIYYYLFISKSVRAVCMCCLHAQMPMDKQESEENPSSSCGPQELNSCVQTEQQASLLNGPWSRLLSLLKSLERNVLVLMGEKGLACAY